MPEKSPSDYYALERRIRMVRVMRDDWQQAEAVRIVEHWNACLKAKDETVLFSPTLRAALISKRHSLDVLCGGCKTVARINLRKLKRPPDTTLHEIVIRLSCQRCRGQAPPPLPVRLV